MTAKKFECVRSRQPLDYTRPLVIHFHLSLGVFQEKVGEASEYRTTNQQIFNIQTEPQCLDLWRFQRQASIVVKDMACIETSVTQTWVQISPLLAVEAGASQGCCKDTSQNMHNTLKYCL